VQPYQPQGFDPPPGCAPLRIPSAFTARRPATDLLGLADAALMSAKSFIMCVSGPYFDLGSPVAGASGGLLGTPYHLAKIVALERA
jgi:hypothetical protein